MTVLDVPSAVATPCEVDEPRDDVGDLDARVVQVVLDLDRVAEECRRADEDVAEDGVAQVADVRRLVRVDVRVLDDDLARARAGAGSGAASKRARRGAPRSRKKLR